MATLGFVCGSVVVDSSRAGFVHALQRFKTQIGHKDELAQAHENTILWVDGTLAGGILRAIRAYEETRCGPILQAAVPYPKDSLALRTAECEHFIAEKAIGTLFTIDMTSEMDHEVSTGNEKPVSYH